MGGGELGIGTLLFGGLPCGFRASAFPASTADRDVAEGATLGPIPPATFAEVPRLRQAVVVVVTELSVGRGTPRTIGSQLNVGFPLPIHKNWPNGMAVQHWTTLTTQHFADI